MKIILKNSLNLVETELDIRGYDATLNFYKFSLQLPEGMKDGEYEYTLEEDDKVISTGLLQIGDYEPNNKQYESNNKIVIYD
jgi:hypothetical protein